MKPKMILFDYGQTLVVEPQFDAEFANKVILRKSTEKDTVYTTDFEDEFCRFSELLFNKITAPAHNANREVSGEKLQQLKFMYFGLTPTMPYSTLDLLFWDSATHGSFPSEGAAEFLALLRAQNIRTGVISNLYYSHEALMIRLDRYLPEHTFDFVLCSSDLLVRKPDPLIFSMACRKAGLSPADIWFVGDHPQADIVGAYNAGMHPVLYTGAHMRKYDDLPKIPFDRVDSFAELQDLFLNA
ncbi:MAG: HAD family hydrolase [Clostridia bacterium]|nr:HAD family hydrolase [Clostridia bacterium]